MSGKTTSRTANHVRLSIQQGSAVTSSSSPFEVRVTFSKAFHSPPNVVVTPMGDDNANVLVESVTTTYFDIACSMPKVTVMWRAIGESKN